MELLRHELCNHDISGLVTHGVGPCQIMQKQDSVGRLNGAPGVRDANLFDLVVAFAQASRIDHVNRDTLDLDGLLHLVPGRAGNRGHDCQLGTGQGIEQGRLARIGLPRNHHLDAFAQQGPLAGALPDRVQRLMQTQQLPLGICFLQKINLFLGKVQGGFDQHSQVNQGVTQCVYIAGKGP